MPSVIVGIGEILWDMLPDGKQLGGAPANFVYHTKALGLDNVNSTIISGIGNDTLGQEILNWLDTHRINKNYLHISDKYQTGTVTVAIDQQGSPSYTIKQNVAWDVIPEILGFPQHDIDAVCFGTLAQRSTLSRQSINNFLSNLPTDTLKIFDINLRQSFFNLNIIEASLHQANIFKINDDELKVIARLLEISGNEMALLKAISKQYKIKLCILTEGSSGSILYSEGMSSNHPGYKVKSIDTVGAGDAFTAACTIGVLKGFDLDTMNNCANQVASYVCTTSGATPELPTELVNLFI